MPSAVLFGTDRFFSNKSLIVASFIWCKPHLFFSIMRLLAFLIARFSVSIAVFFSDGSDPASISLLDSPLPDSLLLNPTSGNKHPPLSSLSSLTQLLQAMNQFHSMPELPKIQAQTALESHQPSVHLSCMQRHKRPRVFLTKFAILTMLPTRNDKKWNHHVITLSCYCALKSPPKVRPSGQIKKRRGILYQKTT